MKDLRKAYIAPDCEYMTFTVDDLIAQACANNVNNMGGTKNSDGYSCTIKGPIGGTLFSEVPHCDEVTIDYCYVASSGAIIFGS